MDMEDNKKRYLDKVVDFMIEDTEYDIYTNRFSDHSETKVDIWFPSDEEGYMLKVHESCYVWDRYFDIFLNHVLKNMSGNLRYFP